MSKVLKIAISLLIVLALIIGGLFMVKKRQKEWENSQTPQEFVYTVEGVYTKKGIVEVKTDFLGIIKPVNTVEITTKIPGYIKKIHVKTNQEVKKGDLIVSVDDTELKSQLKVLMLEIKNLQLELKTLRDREKSVRAWLAAAQNIYRRNEKLYRYKAVSKEALEKSYAEYLKAEAELTEIQKRMEQIQLKIKQQKLKQQEVKSRLSYLNVRSPVDGIVQRIYLREGNMAAAGKPIISIEEKGKYEVVVKLPPDYPVEKGKTVYLNFDGKKLKASVSMVCPSSSPEGLKVVKIRLKNKPKNIPSNSYINVSFVNIFEGIIVPENAVLEMTEKAYLISQKDGKVVKIPVKKVSTDGKTAVVEGVKEDTLVATAPENKLRILFFKEKIKIVPER